MAISELIAESEITIPATVVVVFTAELMLDTTFNSFCATEAVLDSPAIPIVDDATQDTLELTTIVDTMSIMVDIKPDVDVWAVIVDSMPLITIKFALGSVAVTAIVDTALDKLTTIPDTCDTVFIVDTILELRTITDAVILVVAFIVETIPHNIDTLIVVFVVEATVDVALIDNVAEVDETEEVTPITEVVLKLREDCEFGILDKEAIVEEMEMDCPDSSTLLNNV